MDTVHFAVVALGLSATLSLFSTFITRTFSRFFSSRTARRTDRSHHCTTPRTGGIAIVVAFSLSLLVLAMFSSDLCEFVRVRFWIVLLASLIIFITGLADDLYGLNFMHKLFMQTFAAALVVYGAAYRIDALYLPFLNRPFILHEWLSIGLTFIWIIGLCNAVNLADGLDGLAGGLSVIGFFVMLIPTLSSGSFALALIYAVLLGAVLGFLRYNFHSASIFMGDTGALFLGFMFACLAIVPNRTDSTTFTFLPVLAMAFPILDTLLSFLRRLVTGKHPFMADQMHLHHRLMDRFKQTPLQTVLWIHLFSAVMGAAGIVLHFTHIPILWVLTLLACAASVLGSVFFLYDVLPFRKAKSTALYLDMSQPVHLEKGRG